MALPDRSNHDACHGVLTLLTPKTVDQSTMTPNSSIDLRSFLASAQQDGKLDTEGSFTLSADKAQEKLASFALPGEFDWVLKIVQAANLWNLLRLSVAQTRVATSFTFQPDPHCSPEEVLNVLEGRRLNDPAQLKDVGFSPGFRVLRMALLQRTPRGLSDRLTAHDFPWNISSSRLTSEALLSDIQPWYVPRNVDFASRSKVAALSYGPNVG